jgi:hypothetical protein
MECEAGDHALGFDLYRNACGSGKSVEAFRPVEHARPLGDSEVFGLKNLSSLAYPSSDDPFERVQ